VRILKLKPALSALVLAVCAASLQAHAQAKSVASDKARLELLSCILVAPATAQPDHRAAMRWLYATANPANITDFYIAGSVKLGKACLSNIRVTASDAWKVEGDICNERMEDFAAALAEVGISLGHADSADAPTGRLSARGNGYEYHVAMHSPPAAPAGMTRASFTCVGTVPRT
jgi:hypothetical protein